jgi:hypothetical protein
MFLEGKVGHLVLEGKVGQPVQNLLQVTLEPSMHFRRHGWDVDVFSRRL